jgi:hypothetical protein
MSEFTKGMRGIDMKRVVFPFRETRDELARLFEKDDLKHLPAGVASFFIEQIKPYRSGNNELWTLRKLDNINKHRLPVTVFGVSALLGCSLRDTNGNTWVDQTIGVTFGGRVNAISNSAQMEIVDQGKPAINIFINEADLLEGAPILPVLSSYGELTLRVIASVEAFSAGILARET